MRGFIDRIVDHARETIVGDVPSNTDTQSSASPTPSSTLSVGSSSTDDTSQNGTTIVQMARPDRAHTTDSKQTVRVFTLPRCRPKPTLLGRLLALPPELQLKILSYLHFGDLERLRRTCHLFRTGIPKPMIRSLFPDLLGAISSTCYQCLAHEPYRGRLVGADDDEARFPFSNRCVTCVARRGEFVVGRKYILGDYSTVWVCRWCGLPVTTMAAWNQPEFHRPCYRVYNKILLLYFLAGLLQWSVVLIAAVLCWQYFKRDVLVLAPSIVNFIMAFWAFCLALLRGSVLRTYHWALIVEVAISALWIPPIYAIVGHMEEKPKACRVTLAFIGINLFLRLLNIIGNAILMGEYKRWRQSQKKIARSPARRILTRLVSIVIFWTYPQSIEQEYPPTWWFERRQLDH